MRVVHVQRLVQFLNRYRRVRVHFPVPLVVRSTRGFDQNRRRVELGHQAVDGRPTGWFHRAVPSGFASGTSVRISKIEIIGRKRRNRNSSARNKPMVPTYVAQSHVVGAYRPHDEGRKSRWSDVTTMTKRSSHMPTFTISETMKRRSGFVLNFLNQSNCGVSALQTSSAQYAGPYGPVIRLRIM